MRFASLAAFALCACSGGGGSSSSPAPPPLPAVAPGAVSGLSPFPASCGGTGGTVYVHAEVEPHIAVDPRNPDHFVGAWQQDRWSNGSSRGVLAAASFDGGATWTRTQPAFSQCEGGEFQRATDPWVSIAADG